MAFGTIPQHVEEFLLADLTKEQVIVIGIETAKELRWNIGYTSEQGFIAHTQFSLSSYSEAVTVKVEHDKVIVRSICSGNQVTDWGKNKENVEEFMEAFNHLKAKLSPDAVAEKYNTLTFSSSTETDPFTQPIPETRNKYTEFFSMFIPVEGYFITPILININILIFLLMAATGVNIMDPEGESLLSWGANFRPYTLDGQWWRLFTSCFLHIGVLHLFMNMYALVYIGMMLEPLLGRMRFLSAYLLAGIGGSALSLFWHPYTISAGASGAIFGMDGVFLAMLTTNLIEKSTRKSLLTSILVFVGFNLLYGLSGGIDNAAHIGGLISGIIIGYCFYPSLIKPAALNLKYISIAVITIIITSASFILYSQSSNDFGTWEASMDKFAALETEAITIFQTEEVLSGHDMLKAIEDKGIKNWKESIRIITEAESLDIPEELHRRNRKLLEYCQLRLRSYELIYKANAENTDIYQPEIDGLNEQITGVITELQAKQEE